MPAIPRSASSSARTPGAGRLVLVTVRVIPVESDTAAPPDACTNGAYHKPWPSTTKSLNIPPMATTSAVDGGAQATSGQSRLHGKLTIWAAIGLSVGLMAPSMAANINPQG